MERSRTFERAHSQTSPLVESLNRWFNERADNFDKIEVGSLRLFRHLFIPRQTDSLLVKTARIIDGAIIGLPVFLVFNTSRRINKAIFAGLSRLTGGRRNSNETKSFEKITITEASPKDMAAVDTTITAKAA